MTEKSQPATTGRFDIGEVAASFPPSATTLLVDRYLTNREAARARVFRVYKPTPPHYHAELLIDVADYCGPFSGTDVGRPSAPTKTT